ncbi:MAG TPA: GNAT family protein [Capillimicrobium sp.]
MLRFDLTDDAHLRLYDEADACELHDLIVANREHLAPWMPWWQQRAQDAAGFIRESRQAVADDAGLVTAVVVGGRLAGTVGSHVVDRQHGKASLGYWLGAGFEGRGLATRAVAAHLGDAFGRRGLHRAELHIAVGNAPSRAVAERLGFTCEGVMREAYAIGDGRQDIELWSLLAHEWRSDPAQRG